MEVDYSKMPIPIKVLALLKLMAGAYLNIFAQMTSLLALFLEDDARALQKLFSHTLQTIKAGPVQFINQGEKRNCLFELVLPASIRQQKDTVILNNDFFSSYGQFVLDEKLWDCFQLYHSWIEPLVVNQWVKEMQRFKRNRERQISLQTDYDCLVWIDATHDTCEVRNRVEELVCTGERINSVWSGRSLRNEYHIVHCLPFAYWPNNDRWNLFPASAKENLTKSDRLP